jgi:hypothetical protein
MNREPNKEIDILLRKLSGKQNGDAGAAEGSSSASAREHLDTDELSAYAENALPASLRSRYTEHVADCSSCRKIVTQLSLSSTAATAQAVVEQPTPSRLKTLLASLFSPLVIRYAVPGMAVILLVAIAWIVVRREPVSTDVAQNTDSRQALNTPANSPTVSSTPNDAGFIAKEGRTEPSRETQAVRSEDRAAATSAGKKAPEESKSGERPAKEDEPPPPAKTAPPSESVTVAAAPSAGAGSVATKNVSDSERNEREAAKKKAEADTAVVQNQAQNQIQNQDRRASEQNRSGPSEPKAVQRGLRSNQAIGGINRQRDKLAEPQDKDAARDDEAEVRNVGGHRFTKRGNVWIDALYNSNSATTIISRGSDQYRSLMGDEPDLRAIVERLSGELIVVWKARAYRIK